MAMNIVVEVGIVLTMTQMKLSLQKCTVTLKHERHIDLIQKRPG